MVTVGYLRYLAKSLEKRTENSRSGLQTGNLIDLMSGFSYEKYLGLDLSNVAVERANAQNFKNSEFQIAKFEDWESDEKFDFIVSTGAIHYAEDRRNSEEIFKVSDKRRALCNFSVAARA